MSRKLFAMKKDILNFESSIFCLMSPVFMWSYSMSFMKLILLMMVLLAPISHVLGEEDEKLGIEEHIGETIGKPLYFLNHDSVLIDIRSILNRPTILVMAYYRCPGICSPLLRSLAEAIDQSKFVLGKDYQVLTISFNSQEANELAFNKRSNYLKVLNRKDIDTDAWSFFTGDSANIASITQAIGFHFKRQGNDFIHAAVITFIDKDARIVRYLYGVQFPDFDYKMALLETIADDALGFSDRFMKRVFTYKDHSKTYGIGKTAILLFLAILMLTAYIILIYTKRKRR